MQKVASVVQSLATVHATTEEGLSRLYAVLTFMGILLLGKSDNTATAKYPSTLPSIYQF